MKTVAQVSRCVTPQQGGNQGRCRSGIFKPGDVGDGGALPKHRGDGGMQPADRTRDEWKVCSEGEAAGKHLQV